MKKKAVKGSLGAIALASAMTMSMGTPVFAIQESPRPDGYSTEIGGTKTTTFDKYLVMDELRNESHNYSIWKVYRY